MGRSISAWARGRGAGWGAVAALLAALVFAPALTGGFVHDDVPQIVENPLVRRLSAIPTLWSTSVWAGAGSGSSFYRPVMMTSFALEHAVFGTDPRGFHAVELLLFCGVVALAARLVHDVDGRASSAALAALLFAVHPLNAELAAWISARGEVLAALAGLALLSVHRRALRETPFGPPRARVGAAGLFAGALLAKESAVAFVAPLLALDVVCGAPFAPRALLRRYGGLALAAGACAALRVRALGGVSAGLTGAADPGLALGAIGQGVRRIAFPSGLSIAPAPPAPGDVALAVVALAAGSIAVVLAWRRRSPLLVPLALGGAQLAVAAFAAGRIGELADRYLVGPLLAGCWLLAAGISALPERARRPAWVAASVAIAVLAVVSHAHVRVYESDAALWRHALSENPRSLRAALNLGVVHLSAGDAAGALEWLDRAESLSPGDPQVRLNRAVALSELGRKTAATEMLRALARIHPDYWRAQLLLGHLALDRGDRAEAQWRYRAVLEHYALSAEAWAGLGVALVGEGRRDEGVAAIRNALALDPDVQNAASLRALAGDGR